MSEREKDHVIQEYERPVGSSATFQPFTQFRLPLSMSTIVEQNPPRHALESDSEEEFNPQRHDVQSKELEIRLVGNGVGPRSTLIIATRRAGAFWGKGAGLREQTGAVFVNGIEVGLVFNPEWTGANVIVSEVLSRLPVWAMHPYAQAIIDQLKPDRCADRMVDPV